MAHDHGLLHFFREVHLPNFEPRHHEVEASQLISDRSDTGFPTLLRRGEVKPDIPVDHFRLEPLNKRALLVITPVVLLSVIVASLVVYELARNFLERQEQSRINNAVTQLAAEFSRYTTFADSYLLSVTQSHALREYFLTVEDDLSDIALTRHLEDGLRNSDAMATDFLGIAIGQRTPEAHVRSYVQLRGTAMIPNPPGGDNLRPEAARMLQEVLLRGEAARGIVIENSGLKERTGRNVLGQLISEGLLVSDTPKGEVRVGFPIHAAGWFFPELYPVLPH